MVTTNKNRVEFHGGRSCGARAAAGGIVAMSWIVAGGCAHRLSIIQDDYVNTAMHMARPVGSRTGEPLELAIVYVRPKDLKHPANDRLAPNSGITSDVWYRDRPIPGDTEELEVRGGRFWLPKSQVLVMTYDTNYYGTRVGQPLHGAATDKRRVIKKKLSLGGMLDDRRAVAYVFPRFIDKEGRVLPVPPAMFHPPGSFGRELFVRIGVDENRAHFGQYIERTAPQSVRRSGGGY